MNSCRQKFLRGGGFCLLLMLGACSIADEWMGKPEDPPLPGERVSIMKVESTLQPDKEAQSRPILTPDPVTNEMWPQAGGYPDHAMGHLALNPRPQRVWSASVGAGANSRGRLVAAPVVADGTLYALDADYTVTALNASNGSRVWSVNLVPDDESGDALGGGLAYAEGVLFIGTGFAEIVALDPASGAVKWRQKTPSPVRGAPTVADGRVLVMTVDNQLLALSTDKGEKLWSHRGLAETAGVLGGASPAVSGDTIIVPYSSGEIYALKAQNGRSAWSDSLASLLGGSALNNLADIRGLPVIYQGGIFAVSNSGRMVAIDERMGARIWEQSIGGLNMPWVAGNTVYVMSGDNQLVALTRQEGRIQWVTPLDIWQDPEERTGRILMSGPVLAGDVLWVTTSTGLLMGFNPESGEKVHQVDLPASVSQAPVVANKTLYILTDSADIVAYR